MEKSYRPTIGRWMLSAAVLALAGCTAQAARPAKPAFEGEWSVKWCDRNDPKAECGGFYLTLVQREDRLCGTYDGARVRLSQLDEGDPGAVRGVVIGREAVLTIESARSGDLHLVRASVVGDLMRWRVVDTVRDNDGDIDIIALDDTLKRAAKTEAESQRRADVETVCKSILQR